MSDHHDAPDPIDEAYVRAEALLDDEAARAARRARVLAAVASEAVAAPARRPIWRRGGWLAAACVAGLTAFVVVQNYRPVSHPPQAQLQAPPAAPIPAQAGIAAKSTTAPIPEAPPVAVTEPRAAPAPPADIPRPAPTTVPLLLPQPRAPTAPVAAPPPVLDIKPVEHPVPAPPAAPPPPDAEAGVVGGEQSASAAAANRSQPPTGSVENQAVVSDVVVAAEKRKSRIESVPVAVSAYTSSQRDLVDPGAGLRAAAAAGQTKQVEALLHHGVPIDAPDADGDTALIDSIRADHPAVAALLRRHGASLDHRNNAGESARDLATAKGDPDLNKALGLTP